MKILMQKWDFVFFIPINPKTDMCPTIHRIQSDVSLHVPDDSHDLLQNSIIPIFHKRWILVFVEIIKHLKVSTTNTNTISEAFFVLVENPNQNLWNALSPPFQTQPVKRVKIFDYLATSFYKVFAS